MKDRELPGAMSRHIEVPPLIDTLPSHPHRTSAIVMDNFNKRRSLKRDALLSPAHRYALKKVPY